MNRDAGNLIGDLFIQLDRVAKHLSSESEYRQEAVQKFLKLGVILSTLNANSEKWQQAYKEALELWKDIVEKLPYAGWTAEGSRKKFFN